MDREPSPLPPSLPPPPPVGGSGKNPVGGPPAQCSTVVPHQPNLEQQVMFTHIPFPLLPLPQVPELISCVGAGVSGVEAGPVGNFPSEQSPEEVPRQSNSEQQVPSTQMPFPRIPFPHVPPEPAPGVRGVMNVGAGVRLDDGSPPEQ